MKKIIVVHSIFFLCLVCTPVFADDLRITYGIIQKIAGNAITISSQVYYPVMEEVSPGRLKVGDRVNMLYEVNPKGQRYYYSVVHPEEHLVFPQEIPPA